MNNKRALVSAVFCTCCLGFYCSAWAQPDQWQPTLLQPEGKTRGPSDPIQLVLPELPTQVLQSIALELDDVDVTGLVSTTDGRHAVFTPPQPLAYGEHTLRLVENASDGNIIERGVWTIDVRKTAAFRDASLQSNVTVNVTQRVADQNLGEPQPGRTQGNGAAKIQGAVAGDTWRTTGSIDLIGNSQRNLMPRQDEPIDMGQFLLAAEAGPAFAQAGDQVVGPESLVLSNFNRRGVSAGLRTEDNSASLVAFSQRTQSVVGFTQGAGIADPANRTDGVVVSGRPIPSKPDALMMWGTYVSGTGQNQAGAAGAGVAGDPTVTSGQAASVAADGQLFDKRVRLRGEVAQSRFDFDGPGRDTNLDGIIDSNLPAESSHAHTALITYTPWHDMMVKKKLLALTFGVENRRIGTFFRSPANPTSIGDRDLLRGFTNLNWSGLDLQLARARETDNVDDDPLLPRTATRQSSAAATYTPALDLKTPEGAQTPTLPWFGQPSFTANWLQMDQGVQQGVAGFAAGPLRTNQVMTVGATFNYTTWNWTISHSVTDTQEFDGLVPDTRVRAVQLNASFRVAARLTLTPSLQVNKSHESDPPVGAIAKNADNTTAGLGIGYVFTDRINGNASYSRNRQKATDNSVDSTSTDVTGGLSWLTVQARGNAPGVTLSLEGSYHDQQDAYIVLPDHSKYQVFLKAAIGWSPSF